MRRSGVRFPRRLRTRTANLDRFAYSGPASRARTTLVKSRWLDPSQPSSGESARLRLRKFNCRLQQLGHHLMSDRLCVGWANSATGTDSLEGWEGQHGPTNSHRRERNSRPGPRVRTRGWFSRADLGASTGWADPHRPAPRCGRAMADPDRLARSRRARRRARRIRTPSRPSRLFHSVGADPSLQIYQVTVEHIPSAPK
jgi:hypothetical protein